MCGRISAEGVVCLRLELSGRNGLLLPPFRVQPRIARAAKPGHELLLGQAIDEVGLRYHSCTRGRGPYLPTVDGVLFHTPEIPTTWPTLDEVYGRVGTTAQTLRRFYSKHIRRGLNVHTIHAEVEGMKHVSLFEDLLDALENRVEFLRLTDVAGRIYRGDLARCELIQRPVAGRAGTVTTQGSSVLA